MKKQSAKQIIYNFFENPTSILAKIVQTVLIVMIIFSVFAVGYEHFSESIPEEVNKWLIRMEWIILISFTIEYLLRFWTTPESKWKFFTNGYNLIDLLSIIPSFIAFAFHTFPFAAAFRALRFARILRLLKFIRYAETMGIFKFKKTILQVILPVIVTFTLLKIAIVFLEYNDLWLKDMNLGDLFGIVGFALGIIISQKINVAQNKLITVEIGATEISSTAESMMLTMNTLKRSSGKIMIQWLEHYYDLLSRDGDRKYFDKYHTKTIETIFAVTKNDRSVRESLCDSFRELSEKAHVVLNRMDNRTPKAYDVLLHQAVLIYCLMLTLFIPGFAGVVSVMIATYILYGMYQVTSDMDLAIADETMDLISADISDMERMLKKLKS